MKVILHTEKIRFRKEDAELTSADQLDIIARRVAGCGRILREADSPDNAEKILALRSCGDTEGVLTPLPHHPPEPYRVKTVELRGYGCPSFETRLKAIEEGFNYMKLLVFVALLLVSLPAFASVPEDVLGTWKTKGDRSRIELYKCGDKVCGKVAWLKEPTFVRKEDGPVGEVKFDWRNPDPALQKRPILGIQVIDGLTYTGDNKWEKGSCYDPESGNSYKCNMRFTPPDKLSLRGYIGFSLIGRTYILTR